MSNFQYFDIENLKVFNVFNDFAYLESKKVGNDTEEFLKYGLGKFILYSLIIFSSSAVIGNLSARVLRAFNLDHKYKIFRFRNQWYYIFSGEVLSFQKFKKAKGLHFNSLPENQKILITYADILIANPQGNRELYTGFVVDYDLNQDDISQLDKIYLLDAYRYKKPNRSGFNDSGIFQNTNSTNNSYEFSKIDDEDSYSSRTRINIPGDLLVVSGKNILNINLTFIPSKKIEEKRDEEKQAKFKWLSYTLTAITLIIIFIHIFSGFIGFNEDSVLNSYFRKSTLWGKIFAIIYLNQLIAMFIPVKDKNGKYYFSHKTSFAKLIILVILSVILYFLLNNQVICTPWIFSW
ncbi:hypothetical protein [Salegentibacter sp. 24]|uniref:hypothetical protein n=1 Tax=Salegentibacter sp. 24 TaxID=2183986 RepID=UPI00105F85F8|nr:hypothetical protein [Salegentibacter sp. 24]